MSRSRPLAVNLAAVVAAAAVIAAALAIAISTAEGGRQAPDAVNVPSKRDQAVQHFYGVLVHVKSYYHWKRSYSGLSRRTLKLRGPYEFRGVTAATFCVQSAWASACGALAMGV